MSTNGLVSTDRPAIWSALGKSEKDVLADISIIRDWLKTQPHLPEIPNDRMIESFLVTNKFSIERTKQRLDMYYTIRTLIPEMYENSNPKLPQMQAVPKKMGVFVPLPTLTKELNRVCIMKITGSPEEYDTYRFFSNALNVLEVRIQEDLALGDVFIIDYEHLKMGHAVKMTPAHIKKAATIAEKVFSTRIKAIHLINYPSYIDMLFNIAKSILKPKLLSRIHHHSSIEGLYQHVPKEMLPKEYGGEEKSVQELGELWKAKLSDYADRFDKLDKMRVKEDLRPTPLKNDEVLGYHGNFKKLDVD